MSRASPRGFPARQTGSWPFLLLVSMALPRVHIDIPSRRKGSGDAGNDPRGRKRLVDWTDREIVLFSGGRVLPRVRVVLPDARPDPDEVDIEILDEDALFQKKMRREPPAEEGSGEGISSMSRAALSMDDLLKQAIAGGNDDQESIVQGSTVLIEGEDGQEGRDISLGFCYGLLRSGLTVTYVSTELGVREVVEGMGSKDYDIAEFLPDHKLQCVPVYPLIEGTGNKAELLDKLIASPHLRKTDAVVIDSFSDLLDREISEDTGEQVAFYLQGLTDMGKTAFLLFRSGHEGIETLRKAADVHIALPDDDGATARITRNTERHGLSVVRFRIDPGTGRKSRPRAVIPDRAGQQ